MKFSEFLRRLLRMAPKGTDRITVILPPPQIEDITSESEDILSPNGMGVAVSVGKKRERQTFFDATIAFREIGEAAFAFAKCGHQGAKEASVDFYGQSLSREISPEEIKNLNGIMTVDDLCLRCEFEELKNSSIRCCLCGYGIKPGDPVSLYHRSSKGINEPTATFVRDSAVGCMLWDCCPSGGFYAGHWTSEGFKSAFGTGDTAAEEAFSTRRPVVSNL